MGEDSDDDLFNGPDSPEMEDEDALLLESLAQDAEEQEVAKAEASLLQKSESEKSNIAHKITTADVELMSGLSIKNRKVTQERIEAGMEGKQFVALADMKGSLLERLRKPENKGNWACVGVVVEKHEGKSAVRDPYLIWTLSDLRMPTTTTVTLFVSGAAKELDKQVRNGDVLLLWGVRPLLPKDGSRSNSFSLVARLETNILIVGDSADYGLCKAQKGNRLCRNIVNRKVSDYCQEHMAALFQQTRNSRMSLNSSNTSIPQLNGSLGKRVHLSNGSYRISDTNPFSKNLKCSGGSKKGGPKSILAGSSATDCLRHAQEERERKELLGELDDGVETAIITDDGKVVLKSKQNANAPKGKKKDSEMCEKSQYFVKLIDDKVQSSGVSSTTRVLSRGAQRMYAACTGFNLDTHARAEEIKRKRSLERSADPLANKLKDEKRSKSTAKFNLAGGPFVPQASKREKNSVINEKDLVDEAIHSAGPLLKNVLTNSKGTGGTVSFDKEILMRKKRSEEVVANRARQMELKKQQEAANAAYQSAEKKRLVALKLAGKEVPTAHETASTFLKVRPPLSSTAGGSLHLKRKYSTLLDEKANRKTQEVESQKLLQKILGKKSAFADAADVENRKAFMATLEHLESVEKSNEKMSRVTSVKVKAWQCCECETRSEHPSAKCTEGNHELHSMTVTKYFFRCKNESCRHRTTTLGKSTCTTICPKCRGVRWEPCSAYSDRSLGIQNVTSKDPLKEITSNNENGATSFNRRGFY